MKQIFCILLIFFTNCLPVMAAIKIGTPIYDPPYAVNDKTTGVSGADIDLMNIICSRLKWDCDYVPMRYYELFPALEAGKIDFAIGALIITADKQEKYLFTLPYMISEGGFLLTANNPINSVNELQGKRIGALQGREYINYLSQNFLGKFTIVGYERPAELVTDLYNGKVDAMFANYLTILYLQHQYPEYTKVLKEHFKIGNGLGIATLPANKAQVEQINKILLQFGSDGTFIKLYKYNFEFISLHTIKNQAQAILSLLISSGKNA
ncbi:transporter substrate-binding domain-containing protein [Legionella oakridgensis]|uniref:ABC-type amino acid transport/signal transduction systems, periplasmic component/domain protein n=2 Tax=Legionella oakridgensis TaxID=29423 RepID=W0BCG0_9GAMM|nr:transporter substrate-binding domain-containing protein [Legionella oakridgensis]AHE66292.1 ABC-type amino acid transport/signal transduction systems, periplasmic component/domain protein [Legionella oakridgensis ATCC 33761 = DSM 21215]ETO93929.1 amino acid ABC transporter substrate-binding protein, PAAT family [Legionella oakridgensis RV-2-2007]KTD37232.1 arginine ABC transporter substrate-binding protein [Legionella oakridgensis]STY16184.1 arginine ABC transporter substrate-binding protein